MVYVTGVYLPVLPKSELYTFISNLSYTLNSTIIQMTKTTDIYANPHSSAGKVMDLNPNFMC